MTAPWRQWGEDVEQGAIEQMKKAASLPISVRGALMPDAHQGFGLPIGGVLATAGAVIPYAVGVDIACRMRLTVLDVAASSLDTEKERFKKAIEQECRFGLGATFKNKRRHAVMDEDWFFSPVTKKLKDLAWNQLGTSGSGNHFVEFGFLVVENKLKIIEPGRYLALLSHSGSRASGNKVAVHFSKIARKLHPELPRELSHLAWLELDSEDGQEYWRAMELMGSYARANHELIHEHVLKNLGARARYELENHHNFAWKEMHFGRQLVVHRKGATPAQSDTLGIVPGSMATPGYIVRGLGNQESLNSAAHGAGRKMSRKMAKQKFNWKYAKKYLEEQGVEVISACLDEVPMAYKDIRQVMKAQKDLVEQVATFHPKLVKMAPDARRRR